MFPGAIVVCYHPLVVSVVDAYLSESQAEVYR